MRRVRFRHILLASLVVAIVANLAAYGAWALADGAENVPFFLQRIGAAVAVLAGASVAWRARDAWETAVSAGLFSAMLGYGLAWVPVIVLVLMNPPI
jgi:hypothetical protein